MNAPFLGLLVGFMVATGAASAAEQPPNTLSAEDKAAGWRLLFDGRTTQGWRSFRKTSFPEKGWVVEDGCLRHIAKAGGGDIVTEAKFTDYELVWDWKISAGGNGGLKYFITEERTEAIGHEYQLMGEPDIAAVRKDPIHATGSFYAVIPVKPDELPLRTPGAWNTSRVVVRGNQVEHWLNDRRVVAYELGSETVRAGIAASKFRNVAGFGTRFPHHLLLQDHGGDISFRNVRIRPVTP